MTDSMQRALLASMKPIPPMSAARLNTIWRAGEGTITRCRLPQVQHDDFGRGEHLVPLLPGDPIDRSDRAPVATRPGDEVTADEASGARHHDHPSDMNGGAPHRQPSAGSRANVM